MPTVFDRLTAKLTSDRVPFTVSQHAPVYTSEEAAAIRGVPLASGAKALVLKADEQFVMLVIPADRKLDNKKARTALGVRAIRFATADEVLELTGLRPGSIPPFGSLFGLPTHADPDLGLNPAINFNAGDHAISIQMAPADYLASERPALAALS